MKSKWSTVGQRGFHCVIVAARIVCNGLNQNRVSINLSDSDLFFSSYFSAFLFLICVVMLVYLATFIVFTLLVSFVVASKSDLKIKGLASCKLHEFVKHNRLLKMQMLTLMTLSLR